MRSARLGLSFSCKKMGLRVSEHKYGLSFRCDVFIPQADSFAYGTGDDESFGLPTEDKLGFLDRKRV